MMLTAVPQQLSEVAAQLVPILHLDIRPLKAPRRKARLADPSDSRFLQSSSLDYRS